MNDVLEKKAKTLSELLWENELEWNEWLRAGAEKVQLPSKFQEKWIKLKDAEKILEEWRQVLREFCEWLDEEEQEQYYGSREDVISEITRRFKEKFEELLDERGINSNIDRKGLLKNL